MLGFTWDRNKKAVSVMTSRTTPIATGPINVGRDFVYPATGRLAVINSSDKDWRTE